MYDISDIGSDLKKRRKKKKEEKQYHVIAVYTVLINMHPFLCPFMQRVEKGMAVKGRSGKKTCKFNETPPNS